jgi:hypothetical protein
MGPDRLTKGRSRARALIAIVGMLVLGLALAA